MKFLDSRRRFQSDDSEFSDQDHDDLTDAGVEPVEDAEDAYAQDEDIFGKKNANSRLLLVVQAKSKISESESFRAGFYAEIMSK